MKRDKLKSKLTENEIRTLLQFFPKGIIALDLETTGLSPISDKIIEIAAVKLTSDGRVKVFHEMINPEIPIPAKTTDIHGITDAMVLKSPVINKIMPIFLDFIGDYPVVAHNAQFDLGYMMTCMHELKSEFSQTSIYDSFKLAKSAYPKNASLRPDNFKLSTLAKFFNIDLTHHQALDDTIVCFKIFSRCLNLITKNELRDKAFLFKLNSYVKLKDLTLPKKIAHLASVTGKVEKVMIRYSGGTQGPEPRPIKPLSIVPLPQGLILFAECLQTNYFKSFKVGKIKEVILDK